MSNYSFPKFPLKNSVIFQHVSYLLIIVAILNMGDASLVLGASDVQIQKIWTLAKKNVCKGKHSEPPKDFQIRSKFSESFEPLVL